MYFNSSKHDYVNGCHGNEMFVLVSNKFQIVLEFQMAHISHMYGLGLAVCSLARNSICVNSSNALSNSRIKSTKI